MLESFEEKEEEYGTEGGGPDPCQGAFHVRYGGTELRFWTGAPAAGPASGRVDRSAGNLRPVEQVQPEYPAAAARGHASRTRTGSHAGLYRGRAEIERAGGSQPARPRRAAQPRAPGPRLWLCRGRYSAIAGHARGRFVDRGRLAGWAERDHGPARWRRICWRGRTAPARLSSRRRPASRLAGARLRLLRLQR